GRITDALVEEEIARLSASWQPLAGPAAALPVDTTTLDLFDQDQLAAVVAVCRRSASLSAPGRTLFSVSRQKNANPNDA
ncbi:sigma 54-dependent transcriptional regulator, partial [Enterobacter kobei]|nr:sigma 54-dependent transcriptional regulator [Enterobacter kobei]